MRPPAALFSAVLGSALAMGCGSGAAPAPIPTIDLASSAPPEPSASAATPTPAKRALSGESAVDIVVAKGATSWSTIDVELLRTTPIADSLAVIMPFRRSLDRAGVSPQRDFDRMLLVTHPMMTLVEHRVPDAQLERFLDLAVQESDEPASRETIGGHACAKLKNKNGRGTVCPLAPGLLLITNNTNLSLWERLASASLPAPPAGEVMHIEVLDGRPFRYLKVPNSLGKGQLTVALRPDQSLRIDARFESEHPSIDEQTIVDNLPLPDMRVSMEQGAVRVFLEVTPDDADALVAILKVIGG